MFKRLLKITSEIELREKFLNTVVCIIYIYAGTYTLGNFPSSRAVPKTRCIERFVKVQLIKFVDFGSLQAHILLTVIARGLIRIPIDFS